MNPGEWIDYLESGSPRLARVVAVQSAKIQVTDLHGRQRTVPVRALIARVEVGSDLTGESTGEHLLTSLLELAGEIDTELLWESLPEHGVEVALEELSDIYFGEKLGSQIAAVYRAVSQDAIRFRVKNLVIHSRTGEQVAELARAEARRREREAEEAKIQGWLESAVRTQGISIPQRALPLVAEIRRLLFGQENPRLEARLAKIGHGAPRLAAFQLLRNCGELPEASDPFVTMAGVERGFTEAEEQEASALPAYIPPCEPGAAIAIDDEGTREVDDALSFASVRQGLRVRVHIANVAQVVRSDSPLMEAAHRHVSTIYLPNTSLTMLPAPLAEDGISLLQGVPRPALTFDITLSLDGEVIEWDMELSSVIVEERLTYEQMDQRLEAASASAELMSLSEVCRGLRDRRRAAGAFSVVRPEVKMVVRPEAIRLKVIEDSPSRRVVSELMILVNRLAAEYAVRHLLPFLFRGQEPPDSPIDWPSSYAPERLDPLLKRLKRSHWSSNAIPHAGLGLDKYTQVTSPIRRVVDLVLQHQLVAHLRGEIYPFSEEDVLRTMSAVEALERPLRLAERRAVRYYALKYLEQFGDAIHQAIVIPGPSGSLLAELRESLIRGKLVTDAEFVPGAEVQVKVHRIRPDEDYLLLRAV